MDIPFYFKHIVTRHPNVIIPKQKCCDRLFIDFNNILHTVAQQVIEEHPNKANETNNRELERIIIDATLQYTINIIKSNVPKKLLFMAIDGVPPYSRVIQQRNKKYINTWINDELNQVRKQSGKNTSWDSNIITPGTFFMQTFNKCLNEFAKNLKVDFKVVVSDSTEFGECTHKIIDYINYTKLYTEDTCDVIYGINSDNIMSSIINTNADNILLMNYFINDVSYLSIKELKKYLMVYYNKYDTFFVNDYVIICALVGNDFIPPLSYLKPSESWINYLVAAYDEILKNEINVGQLVTKDGINYSFFSLILSRLSNNEDKYIIDANLQQRQTIYLDCKQNKLEEKLFEIENYPKFACQFTNTSNITSNNWMSVYYNDLFKEKNDSECVENICANYIKGLEFIYSYYLKVNKKSDLTYNYKHLYSRTIIDLYNFTKIHTTPSNKEYEYKNDRYKCMMTDEFLMLIVLPPRALNTMNSLLSGNINEIMTSISLGCVHYFPMYFKISSHLKTYIWECSPMLPQIDLEHLYAVYQNVLKRNIK